VIIDFKTRKIIADRPKGLSALIPWGDVEVALRCQAFIASNETIKYAECSADGVRLYITRNPQI
jgi:hypothetical protein